MPAPLGKTPTKKMPNIQVFGLEDSNATRGALRFFRERRIVVHYVDLRKKPIAAGELRRFIDKLGATRSSTPSARAYREQGLAYLTTDTAGRHRTPARRLPAAQPPARPLRRRRDRGQGRGHLEGLARPAEVGGGWHAPPMTRDDEPASHATGQRGRRRRPGRRPHHQRPRREPSPRTVRRGRASMRPETPRGSSRRTEDEKLLAGAATAPIAPTSSTPTRGGSCGSCPSSWRASRRSPASAGGRVFGSARTPVDSPSTGSRCASARRSRRPGSR